MWCLSTKKWLHHYIKVSLQNISSIHKLIQQSLGSHDLNNHACFWASPPRNHWNNFKFSWICTNMQKISSFHQFILEIQSIFLWSDWPDQFLMTPIQKFYEQLLIYVNLYQHEKNHAISLICSGDMLIKKSCTLTGWKHLGSYLRNKNFPKYRI